MGLNRDQLLEAARNSKIGREPFNVPELGGEISVRGMSGKERDKFEEGFRDRQGRKAKYDMRNWRAIFVIRVVVNDAGQPLLNDGDIDEINKVPHGVLDRIIGKSQELSGVTESDRTDLGNDSASEGASGGSSSSSPAS